MNKIIERIFPYLLCIPIFLPLVYMGGLFFPYITLKVLILRGLSFVLLSSFVWMVLNNYEFYWLRLRNKLTWTPAILLILQLLVSVFNPDFFHGFWSSFERGDGIMSFLAIVIYFYVFILYVDKDFIKRFFKLTVISTLLISAYALLQWVQKITGQNIPLIELSRGRVGGTFNNAAFLSSFLLLTIPLTFYAHKARLFRHKWPTLLALVLQLLTIFLASTRSALLAILVGGFLALVYKIFYGSRRVSKYSKISFVALLVVASLFFGFRTQLQESNIQTIKRVASISLTESTVASRLFLWKEITPYVLDKPLGYGAENIGPISNLVYDPSLIGEPWFDRSHNSFVDYAVQFGVLGLLLYLVLIGSLIKQGVGLHKEQDDLSGPILLVAVLYSVNNVFVFDTSLSLWMFLVILAISFVWNSDDEKDALYEFENTGFTGHILAAVILLAMIPVVITPLRANIHLVGAHGAMAEGDWDGFVEKIGKGYDLGTYADIEYGYNSYTWYVDNIIPDATEDQLESIYPAVYRILETNYEKYPDDNRTSIYFTHLLLEKPDGLPETEHLFMDVLNHTYELSPKRTETWFLEIQYLVKQADLVSAQEKELIYKEIIDVLSRYSEAVPLDAKPHFVSADVYREMGDVENTRISIEIGEDKYDGGDVEINSIATQYFISQENWPKAVSYIENTVEVLDNMIDPELAYDLAKLYFLSDDYEKSVAVYNALYLSNKDLVLSDSAFVESIQPFLSQYEK
jgi:O-antigen ligase